MNVCKIHNNLYNFFWFSFIENLEYTRELDGCLQATLYIIGWFSTPLQALVSYHSAFTAAILENIREWRFKFEKCKKLYLRKNSENLVWLNMINFLLKIGQHL